MIHSQRQMASPHTRLGWRLSGEIGIQILDLIVVLKRRLANLCNGKECAGFMLRCAGRCKVSRVTCRGVTNHSQKRQTLILESLGVRKGTLCE